MANYNREDRSGSRRDSGRRDFGKRDFGDRGGRKEMFKTVCDSCGNDCEVPFRPTSGRPVYCSDCFEKKDGGSSDSRNFNDRGSRRPSYERSEVSHDHSQKPQNNEQLNVVIQKLDQIIEVLTSLSVVDEEDFFDIPEEMPVEEKKENIKEKKVTEKKKSDTKKKEKTSNKKSSTSKK